MEGNVALQGANFLEAVAVGAALGALYDLLRVLRERQKHRWSAIVPDLLFWLTATAALFLFAILRGNGEIRLYLGAAFALGGGGYFLTLSRLALPLFRVLADGGAFLWNILTLPGKKLGFLWKKFFEKQKKGFQNWTEWYRINVIYHLADEPQKGVGGREDQAGRHRHKICHPGTAGGHHHRPLVHERAAGVGPPGAGRSEPGGPGPKGAKRRPGRRHRKLR